MDLPWDLYYHKELDFRFSRSYGPGRYDPTYEEGGIDYPIGFVRWTEQRNMQSVLQLMKDEKLDFSKLISHEYKFRDADTVFPKIKEGKEEYLGVILEYDAPEKINMKHLMTRELKSGYVAIIVEKMIL